MILLLARYSFLKVTSSLSSAAPVIHLFRDSQLFLINKPASMCSCLENAPKRSNPAFSGQSFGGRQLTTSAGAQQSTSPLSSASPSQQNSESKMPGEHPVLRFVKLSEKAHAPTKGSALAAGFDLKSAYDYIIPGHGKALVKTDIQIQLPEGCYGRVAPRSGLAWKSHIDIGAGVIDADYTGNLGIVLFNHAPEDFEVKAGDRVAQLICERILYPDLQEVAAIAETARGAGGFGSTGKS